MRYFLFSEAPIGLACSFLKPTEENGDEENILHKSIKYQLQLRPASQAKRVGPPFCKRMGKGGEGVLHNRQPAW